MLSIYEKLNELLFSNVPFVMVTLVDVIGSSPQNTGSRMLVTKDGLYDGTIGGGKVEFKAIHEATVLLENKSLTTTFVEWNLKKDVGMSCGGIVRIFFEAFHSKVWKIAVFGAGHVANALIPLLLPLDCQIQCIDPRPVWLNKLPHSHKLSLIHTDDMASQVKHLDPQTFVLLMTMGHSTDLPILLEILRTKQFPYLGVIGSKAKAVRIKKDIEEFGLPQSCKEAFYCPIGLDLGNNHPREIAISVAAQLIQERDKFHEKHNKTKELIHA
jgi:xanthine dehydrogenase accessory factor